MDGNNFKRKQSSFLEGPRYQLISISKIQLLPSKYPDEFLDFCKEHNLRPPKINSGRGKALSVMLKYRYYYWNREACEQFVNKFEIKSRDSIQLFNKHNQWGIKTNSGLERGKLYIQYPYSLSNKHKMRKRFKSNITDDEKNIEIDKIKSSISNDYIQVPNYLWQLGHKNPFSCDNSLNNLVLQPPIQSKYRDNYIFVDSLTKFPTPRKLEQIITNKEIEFTSQQIKDYKYLFENLYLDIEQI